MQNSTSKKIINWLKNNLLDLSLSLVILLVVVFIAFKNYTAGTFLSGWDNLHSEFNFSLNVQRSLSAVWQEYQGVGLLGGMAHAADLPRQLILWAVSSFMPTNFLRYFWVFLMLFLGSLGSYFLIGSLTKKKAPAFAGAVFYLLNLATIQYFYTPFETFVSFYGFLPWFIYFALNYIKEGGKKKLLMLLLVSYLGSPAFYVQTLFVVYMIFLLVIGLEVAIRKRLLGIKRLVAVVLTVLVVNSYWLLPASYFTLRNSDSYKTSHQNSIASPETRLFNLNRSTFKDIVELKGFWFDYRDLDNNTFEGMMGEWIGYTSTRNFEVASYILFFTSVLGLLFGVFNKKFAARISVPVLFGLFMFMLSAKVLPLGETLSEAFRSVFTKVSVAFSLTVSLGIGYFIASTDEIKKVGKYLSILLTGVVVVMVVAISRPVFEGKLVYKNLKVVIPNEYFELYKFFNDQPSDARIATLPAPSFWGWDFHSWGERGSGFLWYGIKQPILHRSFDVWSPHNETFFNELSFSIYQKDPDLFKSVVRKYQVKYLLLDESVVNAGGNSDILFVPEIKSIISELGYEQVFLQGSLAVFDTGLENKNGFVRTSTSFSPLNVDLTYAPIDPFYRTTGDYLFDETAVGYPFVNFDRRGDVKIEVVGGDIKFTNSRMGASVTLPANGLVIESFGEGRGLVDIQNCDIKKTGSVTKLIKDGGVSYVARDGGVACDYFAYPQLFHNQAYVLRLRGENREGRSLKIYLQNWGTNRFDIEELLPTGKFDEYYFIYPTKQESLGYTLNLETRSFGKVTSENILSGIEFYPVDSELLSGIYKEGGGETVINNLTVKGVEKYGTSLYRVKKEGHGLLVLSQGYEDGWVALANMNGKWQKLSHVKVNSWENGWIVPTDEGSADTDQQFVFVLFWPQLLEWVGLLIGISALLVILRSPTLDR